MESHALVAVLALIVSMTSHTTCLHIEIQYGNFEELTCYTCPMKKDNTECNNWAPNIPCPIQHTVCKSVHRLNDRTGESTQVDKMCSLPEHCSSDHVGCKVTDTEGEIECVSCCSVSYCNVAVPYNVTTSLTQSASLIGSTASHGKTIYWTLTVAALITWSGVTDV